MHADIHTGIRRVEAAPVASTASKHHGKHHGEQQCKQAAQAAMQAAWSANNVRSMPKFCRTSASFAFTEACLATLSVTCRLIAAAPPPIPSALSVCTRSSYQASTSSTVALSMFSSTTAWTNCFLPMFPFSLALKRAPMSSRRTTPFFISAPISRTPMGSVSETS